MCDMLKGTSTRTKQQLKPSSHTDYLDCSVCTFKNSAKAFTFKGTSARTKQQLKPSLHTDYLDCSACTFKNSAKAFKFKGTSAHSSFLVAAFLVPKERARCQLRDKL